MVTLCNGSNFAVIVSVHRGDKPVMRKVTVQYDTTKRFDSGDLDAGVISLCDHTCQYKGKKLPFRPGWPVIIEDGDHLVQIKHEIDDHH
jgi:hypothetical protein